MLMDGRLEKNNQRGVTWKIRKEEQSILCATHRTDLIHIPIKFHENIPNGYRVVARTRMFGKKSTGHNLETKTGGTIILMLATSSLPNTYSYKIA